jgi:hypothetical protein
MIGYSGSACEEEKNVKGSEEICDVSGSGLQETNSEDSMVYQLLNQKKGETDIIRRVTTTLNLTSLQQIYDSFQQLQNETFQNNS